MCATTTMSILEHFYHLKKQPRPIGSACPLPLASLAPANHKPTFGLYRFASSGPFL